MNGRRTVDLDNESSARDARTRKESIDIDMNPMVDLAFLLLTFFMLTTTFARPQAMEVLMPVKPKPGAVEREQPVKESRTISIVLSGENRIFWYRGITDPQIEESDYSPEGIHTLLKEFQASIEGLVVLIKPEEASNYKNLVDILDEMKTCAISRYAITDISPKEQELIATYQP